MATLWVSWQLDGGAAAVNEAGRKRMQSYRLSLAVGTQDLEPLLGLVKKFDQSLATLKSGDPDRPLFVPWDDGVHTRFETVEADWQRHRARWLGTPATSFRELSGDTVRFAASIDAFVGSTEAHIARADGVALRWFNQDSQRHVIHGGQCAAAQRARRV